MKIFMDLDHVLSALLSCLLVQHDGVNIKYHRNQNRHVLLKPVARRCDEDMLALYVNESRIFLILIYISYNDLKAGPGYV